LRLLRFEVYVSNVYITNQFQTTFARGGGGGGIKSPLVEVIVNSKKETLKTFVSILSKNLASVEIITCIVQNVFENVMHSCYLPLFSKLPFTAFILDGGGEGHFCSFLVDLQVDQ
jgi:hypothetical protein